jgi:hypothetical protein
MALLITKTELAGDCDPVDTEAQLCAATPPGPQRHDGSGAE